MYRIPPQCQSSAHCRLQQNIRSFPGNLTLYNQSMKCSGLLVSVLASGLSGPCSSPGWRHFVVLLGETHYSHSATLHPGVHVHLMSSGKLNAEGDGQGNCTVNC